MRIISDIINVKCNFYPKTTVFVAMFNAIATHTLHSTPIFFPLFLNNPQYAGNRPARNFQKENRTP